MTTPGLSPALAALKKITIVGTGLIGASVAAALKSRGYSGQVVGCARSQQTLDKALQLGLVDEVHLDVADAVRGADLVLLAVPMMAGRDLLERMAPALSAACIVTDGGSVKGRFIEDAKSALGSLTQVVPAHPVAGKEFSGVEAADPSLYYGHTVILTPDETTDSDAIETVAALWRECGAIVEIMSAADHDKVLAATSHMPHLVAFSVVDMLSRHSSRENVFKYSAGGFRDFTRIASGDPEMWRDICLCNDVEIGEILDTLIGQLSEVRQLVGNQQGAELEKIFENSKKTRDGLIEKYDKARLAQTSALADQTQSATHANKAKRNS